MPEQNTILIVCDQMINYKRMPKKLRDILPGYQAFKKIGVEFNNIYNNKQDCSPSRASFQSSKLNVNIWDNIDFNFQYDYQPQLDTNLDTIGKTMKRNGIDTAYYGKNHFVSAIATDAFTVPAFNTNTRKMLNVYGFDIYNTYGDTYYYNNEGYFGDNNIFDCKVNNSNPNYDYQDCTGKYIGVIPYLKSRVGNPIPFHLQVHLENPHDTQHFWQNFKQTPTKLQLQFFAPYINEQIEYINSGGGNVKNPFIYENQEYYIEDPNLIANYFENTFAEYMSDVDSLPFKDSYLNDYCTNPKYNSVFPYFVGMYSSLTATTTMPENQNDIMSWKNLINNYYGLILDVDLYIYKIFCFLKRHNMLRNTSVVICSDHGDQMSAHGLKQKGYHYEEGTNIAFLVYSPKIMPICMGKKCSTLGSLLDLAPTLESLAGVNSCSYNFLGNTLFRKENGYLVPRARNIPVFNIYFSWMTNLTYFYYLQSVKSNSEVKSFFKYISVFTMVVDVVNGKQYKLARYFNFIELILYNMIFNTRLQNINFKDYITRTEEMSLFLSEIDNLLTVQSSTVRNQFEEISSRFGDNSVEQILFIGFVANAIRTNTGFNLIVPGYYNDTYPIYNKFTDYLFDPDGNYYFFLHNLTEDPNEVINLLDKNNINDLNIEIGNTMNIKLNQQLEKYNIVHMDFIIPNKMIIALAINIKLSGNNISDYTPIQLENINSCLGQNRGTAEDKKMVPYYDNIIALLKGRTM